MRINWNHLANGVSEWLTEKCCQSLPELRVFRMLKQLMVWNDFQIGKLACPSPVWATSAGLKQGY
jgi:hypothetical protein